MSWYDGDWLPVSIGPSRNAPWLIHLSGGRPLASLRMIVPCLLCLRLSLGSASCGFGFRSVASAVVQRRVVACGRCAYNGINGSPMCMSPMIGSVLRDEFNFTARPENYVVTDSGALDFMVSRFHRFNDTGEDAAVAALHAGVDLNSGGVYSSAPQRSGSDRSRNAASKRPRSVVWGAGSCRRRWRTSASACPWWTRPSRGSSTREWPSGSSMTRRRSPTQRSARTISFRGRTRRRRWR